MIRFNSLKTVILIKKTTRSMNRSNNQRHVYNPTDDYMTLYNAFVTYDDQCNSEFIHHNNNIELRERLQRLNVYIDNI